MDYVMGIDGGGTHFRIRACTVGGKLLGEYFGPSLVFTETEAFAECLAKNVRACLRPFGGTEKECRCLVYGTSGIDSTEDETALKTVCRALFGPGCLALCMNDAELANYSINGGIGILLNSGTGSIAFGMDARGRKARVGGWPVSVFGEEGSGAWVARKALRHLGKWFDHVVPDSAMVSLVRRELGLQTRKQFVDFCIHFVNDDILSVAPLVDRAALSGDEAAVSLLKAAASESFTLVDDLAPQLGFGTHTAFKVGLWGSNVLKSTYHVTYFTELLKRQYPYAQVCFSDTDSITFATRLAAERYIGADIPCGDAR
jgi:N-acetylglucosamine kinase-like BadF-type ATPase